MSEACNGARPSLDHTDADGGDGLNEANEVTHEITCKELVEVITDYVEGAMPQAERRRFEAHLETCPYCVNYLEQMRETIGTLGELREDAIAPDEREALLDAFHDWRG